MSNKAPKVDAATWLLFTVSLIAILLVVYVLLSNLYSTAQRNMTKGVVDNTQLIMSVSENLKPIGVSAVAGMAAPKTVAARSGKEIFTSTCFACHGTGAAGAPKLEKAAWEPRVATGLAALLKSALNGKGAMPARGGNPALSDAEIKSTILYMTKEAGFDLGDPTPAAKKETKEVVKEATAKVKEVVTPAKPEVPTAPVVATTPTAPKMAATAPSSLSLEEGKKVYDTACFACHASGVAGSPKFGDKDAWSPRIATGMDSLYNTALNGKGAMPPKGGNMSLADDKVKAAVNYMVEHAK